jgi:hypothetical protein
MCLENGKRLSKQFYYIGIPLLILGFINAHFWEEEEHIYREHVPIKHAEYPYLHTLTRVI